MSVDNILAVYAKATRTEIKNGIRWYKEARAFCKDLAKKYDVTLDVVIAVIAALSPMNKWERNLIDAVAVFECVKRGEGPETIKVSTFGKNKQKAFDIITGHAPRLVKYSNKTAAFWDNIRFENSDLVTVDRHAWRVFIGATDAADPKKIGDKEYETIAEAYRIAAKMVGMRAYELQAVTWVTFKRTLKEGKQIAFTM